MSLTLGEPVGNFNGLEIWTSDLVTRDRYVMLLARQIVGVCSSSTMVKAAKEIQFNGLIINPMDWDAINKFLPKG